MADGPNFSSQASRIWILAPALMVLLQTGCAPMLPQSRDMYASTPAFSPESFFQGKTEGNGAIAVVLKGKHAVVVHSVGELRSDGSLVLSQLVDEEGKPRRQRTWSIRQVSPRNYTGTLSDAAGPVTGRTEGNMLLLSFRMTGGLAAEQRLYLQPGGRVVLNRMTVRKIGVVVAVLSETIQKVE